jgi:hypothetical protein
VHDRVVVALEAAIETGPLQRDDDFFQFRIAKGAAINTPLRSPRAHCVRPPSADLQCLHDLSDRRFVAGMPEQTRCARVGIPIAASFSAMRKFLSGPGEIFVEAT